jgi:PD-(D/E)XK nuclease superfamily
LPRAAQPQPDLPTKGNEAKEELVFQRNANSNFVFLPRNSLQKETKERKAGLVQQNTIFVFFVIFCLKSAAVHPLDEKADRRSQLVIGAAIEVHRHKGPGLIESIYERCLLRELELRSVPATTQKRVRVEYKGLVFDEPLRFDVLVTTACSLS